jgi:hypothetical protein
MCGLGEKVGREKKGPSVFEGSKSRFEGRRAALFHQANLPSLEEAIAAMA